jgi:ribosomal protein S18 acetylase RimI-like enzyme
VTRVSSGIIQGSFVGGKPRIVQAALAARPALPAKPAMVQFKPDARGRLAPPPLPPRVVPIRGGPVQAKGAGGAFPLPPGFRLRTGGGQSLPPAVQAHMEGVFGARFADVRVHVGNEAPSIGALAFTHGTDVYFAPGQYQPGTPYGLRLIGHELTHVVQQRAGRVRNPLPSGVAVVQDAALEAEADRMGATAAAPIQAKLAAVRNVPRPNSATIVVGGPGPVRDGGQKIEARVSGQPGSVGSIELVPAGSNRLKIINLKVDPDHRRRSIGTRLVAAAIQAAQRRGAANVVLEARPSDASISFPSLVKMYTGLGFRQAGISSRGAAVMQRCTGASMRDAAFQMGEKAALSPRHAVQAKLLSGSVHFKMRPRGLARFDPAAVPLQLTPHSRHCRCGRVGFFHPTPKGIIQRMNSSDEEDDYPLTPPPTPAHNPYSYFASGAEYHQTYTDMDTADAWWEKAEKHHGGPIGQSYGSQESEDYDASYVDVPPGCRPSAPASLWKQVYAGLAPKHGDASRQVIACDELGDGNVEIDAKTKCEIGTNKRPPMCHIIPFNHIKWGLQWIYDNKTHSLAKGYKGPDVTFIDADTFKALVWDLDNLRPGHATCNSQTASSAKGNPKTKDEAGIIKYVVTKLRGIQASWF